MPSHRSPTRSSKSSKSRKSPDRSKKHKHYRSHNDHDEHDHQHHHHTHHSNDSHRHHDTSRDKLSVSSNRKNESLSRKRHYSPEEESPDRKGDNKKSKVRAKEEKDEEYISRRSDHRRESPKVKEESHKSEPKGLADLLPDEDAANWVLKSRKIEEERLKIEKLKAERKARILDEMDDEIVSQVAGPSKSNINQLYTEQDLKGLKVAHSEKYLKEGHQIIMTLKDKDVLDENEDVLENVNIVDLEKAEKNMDNKLKKNEYRPYDEPEFDEFGILKKKNLLAKYDEEIDGMKKDSFQIGSSIDREKEAELIRERLRQQAGKISLDTPQFKVASEYYTEEEMTKFKKPKKIRAKKKGKRFSEDVIVESKNSDHGSRKNRNSENVEEVPAASSSVDKKLIEKRIKVQMDDDLLQSDSEIPDIDLSEIVLEEQEAEEEFRRSLEKAKKLKEKEKEKKDDEERIAKLIAEREASIKKEQEDDYSDAASTSQGRSTIVLNATAEFCRNLGDISTIKEEYEDEDELMDFEKDLLDDRRSNEILEEKSPEQPIRGTWNEVDMEASVASFDSVEIADPSQPILEEEPDVSHGVAAALKVAMKKGYLDKEPRKQVGGSRHSSLQAQNYTIEEKFYDEEKLGRRGDRYNGPLSDFKEKDSYKPDVKLDYVDEKGRLLNQKEAFRVLSHKFHGKGPGKNKIDKRMKKLDQEGKLRQMHSTDTPLGTLKLLQDKQKELHTPYVVLSGASTSLTKK